jgi:hypothetical protein
MAEPGALIGSSGLRKRRVRFTALLLLGLLATLAAPAGVFANDPGLVVHKTPDAASVPAGSPIGFTITVTINPTTEADPLCLVVTATSHQCPAVNVVLRDELPASPVGLVWAIDNANSDAGCDIGVTSPGFLTCNWGTLSAPNETRRVHITSPTMTSFGALCGTITNALVTVSYNTADGTARSASDGPRTIDVACATPSPSITPPPSPTSSVQRATTPPKVTLPPTDMDNGSQSGGHGNVIPMVLLLVAISAGTLTLAFGRRGSLPEQPR